MTPLQAARTLAAGGFTPWEDSCHLICELCGAGRCSVEGGPFPHTPACPWLQMPAIVAALERLAVLEIDAGPVTFAPSCPEPGCIRKGGHGGEHAGPSEPVNDHRSNEWQESTTEEEARELAEASMRIDPDWAEVILTACRPPDPPPD